MSGWPQELKHGELCAWRFGGKCDCALATTPPSAWKRDARSPSLPSVDGLTLGDPRIDTLREEGAL